MGEEGKQKSEVLSRAGDPFTFAGLAKAGGARLSVGSISALHGELADLEQFMFIA